MSYWRFDDDGALAKDQQHRADGTLAPGVGPHAEGALVGDSDAAFSFDGATGVVAAPDVYPFNGTAPFTVEVWIAPRAGGLPIQRICNHRIGPPHTGWRMILDEGKHVVFDRWNAEVVIAATTPPLPVDVYSYVVGRYDGAELRVWVDGVLAASAADTHGIGTFAAQLTWGAASTSTIDFFSGRLDEAAIYDYALGEDRLRAHWAAARP